MQMKHKITFIILLLSAQIKAQTNLPQVVNGKIDRIDKFTSKYVTPRNIDIWLPSGYSDSTKYAVLYMHDGQMLYDPNITWNKQAWEIDDVASVLLSKNKVRKFIVVGIWNGGQTRHQDYFPQKPYESLQQIQKDTISAQLQRAGRTTGLFQPKSDSYLKFIVEELKPYIDNKYSVYTDSENTFIAGSSMGGLISLYAICEYPQVFGGAACLSTHWVGTFTLDNNPFPNSMLNYLSNNLPNPKNHKLYFDCGDQTLDALYPLIQNRVDSIMNQKGYNSQNWLTRYFPGENHSEKAWGKRLSIPLEFLLSLPTQP
jgi:predicted alpha/beta superfamily hydrolase